MSEPVVGTLREGVRRAVAASSLRAVAEQVGLTHRGLAKFLEGSTPHSGTVRKLTRWYVSHPSGAEPISPDVAKATLTFLLSGIPEATIERAVRDVATHVRVAFVEAGVPPPGWIDAVVSGRR